MLSFHMLLSSQLHPDTFTLLDIVSGPVSHTSYQTSLSPDEIEASLAVGEQSSMAVKMPYFILHFNTFCEHGP